jgi:hypothetical protein
MSGNAKLSVTPVHWAETTVEVVAGLALAAAGMASGFTHLIENATKHAVSTPLAWATAVTVELCVVYAGLKVRRRVAELRPVWLPAALLVAGFGLSMASQLATAERTAWGWIYAAWPVLAFLWVAKLTVSDLAHRAEAVDHERSIEAAHATQVQRLTTQVHELGQKLVQAEAVNRSMDQDATQRVNQLEAAHGAEVDQLRDEVQRLTVRLSKAQQERPAVARRPEPAALPAGETQAEKAARVAAEWRVKHGKRPTQSELADAADVSVSTAKRALSEMRDEPAPVLALVEGAR